MPVELCRSLLSGLPTSFRGPLAVQGGKFDGKDISELDPDNPPETFEDALRVRSRLCRLSPGGRADGRWGASPHCVAFLLQRCGAPGTCQRAELVTLPTQWLTLALWLLLQTQCSRAHTHTCRTDALPSPTLARPCRDPPTAPPLTALLVIGGGRVTRRSWASTLTASLPSC